MKFSTYFWNGCHAYIEAPSYEAALEKAKEMASEMGTAVDYLLSMPS